MSVNGGMIASPALETFITVAEGKHLDEATGLHAAYEDEIGTGKPWTIGYGHTTQSGITIHGVLDGKEYHGEEVVPGLLIDEDEARRLLRITIARKADIVRTAIQVPLNQNQFDALVDMAYNLGGKPFRKGSDIVAALNGGVDDRNIPIGPKDYDRVADEFLRWGKAQGKPLASLHSRRIAAALRYKSLPWQWPLYNPAITLATSLAVAEETARDMQDMPLEDLEPRTTYTKIVEMTEPYVEQAREAEAVSREPYIKPHSAHTRAPQDVYYTIDPNAGLKPLSESSRVAGYVWQQVGIAGMRVAAATGTPTAALVVNDPQLQNAVVALFVQGGIAATSLVGYTYGSIKRRYGEKSASQGLY